MPSRSITDAHPYLQKCFPKIDLEYRRRNPDKYLKPVCTHRSTQEQAQLWLIGRRGVAGESKVTNVDGTTRIGNHNYLPSLAIDVGVFTIDLMNGKEVYLKDVASYDAIGPIVKELGLRWGGDWKMKDRPHIEVPYHMVQKALKGVPV